MKKQEIISILVAILVFSIVLSFRQIVLGNFIYVGTAIIFSASVIFTNIGAKKLAARTLDSDVEHDFWYWQRYGFKPGNYLKKKIPAGVALPLILTAFSLGFLKCMTFLTYETTALRRRAVRRFGFYSFTEMTDWHNSLIGAGGIIALLALSFITYWSPFVLIDGLWKVSAFYAFWNMLPVSRFDGAQIFFGSRVLWTALALITAVFTAYALILV